MTKAKHEIPARGFFYRWHPGRLRSSIPVIGEPNSPERMEQSKVLLQLCDLNTDIKEAERKALLTEYLALPLRLT